MSGTKEVTLAVDPGAERMGWALFVGKEYADSGIWRFPKNQDEPFQEYRIRLEEEATREFIKFIVEYEPHRIVNEILPAVGGGNFVVATQSYLANVALTCLHSAAFSCLPRVSISQIGSTSIKSRLTGNKKATKVAVRNAVIEQYPELSVRKKDWTKEFDEPDAIATGAAHFKGEGNV